MRRPGSKDAGRRWLALIHLTLLTGCAVTPLTNKIPVGEEPFVIGVGEGPDSMTDLYAASAAGGAFARLTFNRLVESAPRLSASGTAVAYLRRDPEGAGEPELVVLNLLNGAERRAPIAPGVGAPHGIGWRAKDAGLALSSDSGTYGMAAPPAAAALLRLHGADSAAADSVTGVALGEPVAAMVTPCAGGGLCVRTAAGTTAPLDSTGHGAVRWGNDSVGYFTARGFEVRPLTGGVARRPVWTSAPSRLRDLTYHRGAQLTTATGVSGSR